MKSAPLPHLRNLFHNILSRGISRNGKSRKNPAGFPARQNVIFREIPNGGISRIGKSRPSRIKNIPNIFIPAIPNFGIFRISDIANIPNSGYPEYFCHDHYEVRDIPAGFPESGYFLEPCCILLSYYYRFSEGQKRGGK